MPLTKTGKKILKEFKDIYGKEQGENYFYATMNEKNIEEWEKKDSNDAKDNLGLPKFSEELKEVLEYGR